MNDNGTANAGVMTVGYAVDPHAQRASLQHSGQHGVALAGLEPGRGVSRSGF